jgi:hypothetical protein
VSVKIRVRVTESLPKRSWVMRRSSTKDTGLHKVGLHGTEKVSHLIKHPVMSPFDTWMSGFWILKIVYYEPHRHWVGRGTGTPKDKDEVNRQEVCEWEVFLFWVVQDFVSKSVVYDESRKWEVKIRLMNEGRCDERQKARVEESTWLTYTGLYDITN